MTVNSLGSAWPFTRLAFFFSSFDFIFFAFFGLVAGFSLPGMAVDSRERFWRSCPPHDPSRTLH